VSAGLFEAFEWWCGYPRHEVAKQLIVHLTYFQQPGSAVFSNTCRPRKDQSQFRMATGITSLFNPGPVNQAVYQQT